MFQMGLKQKNKVTFVKKFHPGHWVMNKYVVEHMWKLSQLGLHGSR